MVKQIQVLQVETKKGFVALKGMKAYGLKPIVAVCFDEAYTPNKMPVFTPIRFVMRAVF
jgi:hypothetical protein